MEVTKKSPYEYEFKPGARIYFKRPMNLDVVAVPAVAAASPPVSASIREGPASSAAPLVEGQIVDVAAASVPLVEGRILDDAAASVPVVDGRIVNQFGLEAKRRRSGTQDPTLEPPLVLPRRGWATTL